MKTSILINNYNNGRYLRETVESALNQSQPADEVIIYDDGSTDNSLEILRSFGDRIQIISGQRTGLPSFRAQANGIHQAFLASTGDLLFLLDGDDTFLPTKIASYAAAWNSNPAISMIQSPMQQIDEKGNILGSNYDPHWHQDNYLQATYREQSTNFYYATSALAFPRNYLSKLLPLDFSDQQHLWADSRLSITAPLYGPVLALSEIHTTWRRHTRSDSINSQKTRLYHLQKNMAHTRVFNHHARAHGHRSISLWRNPRTYLQIIRAYSPAWCFELYWKLTHSKAKKT